MIDTTPNYIKNPDLIVSLAKQHSNLFKFRDNSDAHEGLIPNVPSRFSTLYHTDMSEELIGEIFKGSLFDKETTEFYSFIQIQRYLPGDYIVPHHDLYHITKLHLITLTTSDADGFCAVVNNKIYKVFDVAGTYIDFPINSIHWVDPVKYERYSLVIGM